MKYEKIRQFARDLRKRETKAEKVFWSEVRGKKFMSLKFNRQFVIEHSNIMNNKSYFIADFHCFSKRLIIEIDGDIHKEQIEYDEIREAILKEMGYHIIRFTNDEVLNNWQKVKFDLERFILKIA